MNICFLVGAAFPLVAVIFGILVCVVKEFVTASLPLDDEGTEFSCNFANLGVYITEYDPGCLDPAVLAESRLPVEAFNSPTTEFKLLFPAQEEYYNEVLPVDAEVIAGLSSLSPDPTGTNELLTGLLEAATPEFEGDCDAYMASLRTGNLNLFATLDTLIQSVLLGLLQDINDAAAPDFNAALQAAYQADPTLNAFAAAVSLSVQVGFATPNTCGPGNTTLEFTDTIASATEAECMRDAVLASLDAVVLPGTNPTANGVIKNVFNTLIGNCDGFQGIGVTTYNLCVGLVDVVPDQTLLLGLLATSGLPALDVCSALACTGVASVPQAAFIGSTVIGELLAGGFVTDGPTIAALSDAASALGAVALVSSIYDDEAAVEDATSTLQTSITNFVPAELYPASFFIESQACRVLQIPANTPVSSGGVELPNLPATDELCTFLDFIQNIGTLALANPNTTAFGPLFDELALLYGACALAGLAPADCTPYWPPLFLNGIYSSSLNLTAYDTADLGQAVYDEAADKCEEDDLDATKIESAQVLIPIAIVIMSIGAFLAVIAGVIDKPVVAIVAGALSFFGGVFVLAGLLNVQAAPIYASVGGEPESLIPSYEAGVTLLFGLVCIGLSCAGGLGLGVAGGIYLVKGPADGEKAMEAKP